MNLADYKDSVAVTATVVTIIQFLSGIDICFKIAKQGSTGDLSGFPFVGGVFSTCMWLSYGWVLHDVSMSVTNGVGLFLQATYLLIYIRYCIALGPWYALRRQMMVLFTVGLTMLYLTFFTESASEVRESRLGLVCCAASILFCASPLISLKEVFRTQSTECLPLPLILATFIVTGLWWLYGVIIENGFVQYPNLIGCIISGLQLLLFVIYPRKRKGERIADSRPV
ncbi:sugar transporter SWEET1-like isoform X1 [Macrobrachium rosenbergii]|uniref:sugar transporter SWEET1-like isoform X1 n=1 Tax=Macrobrachium rosenbergii TaxID=79674 RepID=UPI0034D68F6B